MKQTFTISRGDWDNKEPVVVIADSHDKAVVQALDGSQIYELEIEWDDVIEGYKEWGVGYVNGKEVASVYQFDDSMDWYAKEIGGGSERDDRDSPFVALAQVAFNAGVGW